jgi:hypothetical protein
MVNCCGIFERDVGHARRLKGALDERRDVLLRTMLFTEAGALRRCLVEDGLKVLVVDEDTLNECGSLDNVERVLVLTREEGQPVAEGCVGVYRYQPADGIIRRIMENAGDARVQLNGRTEYMGVYSPVDTVLGTALSLAIARVLAILGKSVLYINLNEFSGLSELLPNQCNRDLSDCLYDYRNNFNTFGDGFRDNVCQVDGISYIPCAACADDLLVPTGEEWTRIVTGLGQLGGYDVVLLELGHMVRQPWLVWSVCERRFMPVRSAMSYMERRRLQDFEGYMLQREGGSGMDGIQRVVVDAALAGEAIDGDFLGRVEYGGYAQLARRVLGLEDGRKAGGL